MARQAYYIDSCHGALTDVEMSHNVAHDCKGAGFVLSVEGGAIADHIQFHHNLLYDNWGTGIFFSRWGNDGLRRNARIYNHTVYRNGNGQPKPGEQYFWLTGGLYISFHQYEVQGCGGVKLPHTPPTSMRIAICSRSHNYPIFPTQRFTLSRSCFRFMGLLR